ncbi:hypothetical protein [Okeania sp. SIO1I7]|uniref:hypothetical protein n=1 Tax=Okeania sp. SIO1I7 TaxID=2607772 RepID=UPI0013FA8DA2|nr:hypothetical protein [Okeania sp. SIO1I7]NET29826.1 hypothetical protein [Okeania sp. SIO1I7]
MANINYEIASTTEQPALGTPSLNTLLYVGGPTVAVIVAVSLLLYVVGRSQNSLLKTLMSGLRKLDDDRSN